MNNMNGVSHEKKGGENKMDAAGATYHAITELSPEMEEIINSTLTRQCKKVLRELFECRLSNKELAKNIEMSSSALSNILQRIKSSQLGLLVTEQNGRNTYYSLSPLGNEYVRKNLVIYDASGKTVNVEETLSQYALYGIQAIKDMQREWGEEWQLKLDELLLMYFKEEKDSGEKNFDKLIQAVKNVIIEERWEELNKIYSAIDNELLHRRIEKCFEWLMGIKYLCIIEDAEWKTAYKLIDDYFAQKGVFVRLESLKALQKYQIYSEEIYLIFNTLEKMVTRAAGKNATKEDFCGTWESAFESHERLMYYIAEKYMNIAKQ